MWIKTGQKLQLVNSPFFPYQFHLYHVGYGSYSPKTLLNLRLFQDGVATWRGYASYGRSEHVPVLIGSAARQRTPVS